MNEDIIETIDSEISKIREKIIKYQENIIKLQTRMKELERRKKEKQDMMIVGLIRDGIKDIDMKNLQEFVEAYRKQSKIGTDSGIGNNAPPSAVKEDNPHDKE